MNATETGKPFLSDVQALRERTRQYLSEGTVTPAYIGDALDFGDRPFARSSFTMISSMLVTSNAETGCLLQVPLP